MTRYSLMAALCILITLATCASASAAATADAPEGAQLLTTTRAAESLRIAQEFWRVRTPCVRVFSAKSKALAEWTGTRDATVLGATRAGGCAVYVNSLRLLASFVYRISTCTTIVHELGHVLGLIHAPDDPQSIMNDYHDDNEVVWGCWKRFMPRGRSRWWRSLYGAPAWLYRDDAIPRARPRTVSS